MDGAEGVASAADAGGGGCEIKDGLQALVLEVDTGYTPKGRVWFKVKLKRAVEVGGIEMGMEDIASVTI